MNVPIWSRFSYEKQQTIRAGFLWTVLLWFIVPVLEFQKLFSAPKWGIFPLFQRALLSAIALGVILTFRDKYIRIKTVAESAEWFVNSGWWTTDNDGKPIFINHAGPTNFLEESIEKWKGLVRPKRRT